MDNLKISIIIPVYNVAQYIDQCLQSVVDQSYTDWECILVDDGSKDDSGAKCDEWCKRDFRFRAIHQQNQGVSAARNKGLEVSQGAWVCFVDSDDWLEPDYLKHLVDAIADDVDYVISGNESILNGEVVSRAVPPASSVFSLDATGADPMADLLEPHLPYGPTNKLFRNSLIRDNGLKFTTHTSYGEDLLFNFSFLEHARKVAAVPVVDYFYRQVLNTSLSHKSRPNRFDNDYMQWCVRRDFLISHDLWSERIQRYMYRELWGVVYDGLFETSANRTYAYIRNILSIPEIHELAKCADDFSAARWIKWLILHRQAWVFWLMFKK